MNFIKTLLTLFVSTLFLLFSACGGPNNEKQDGAELKGGKRIVKENLNIIITPDLSNRVVTKRYPKPVNDVDLVHSVFDNYYPELYEYGHRVNGQKDVIHLAFTNKNIIREYNYTADFKIDIYKKEAANRLYLKTFDGAEPQFKADSRQIVENLTEVYKKAEITPAGADIFSFFKNRITSLVKQDILGQKVQNYVIDTKFRNIVVLFTDGYVEAGLYGKSNCVGNQCYYLTHQNIHKFRKDYKKNGKDLDLKTFFEQNGYGIVPIENKQLKNVEVYVCELYDRSLNKRTGSQTVVPNDLDIIKLFWSDWLTKSGVKKFELKETVGTVEEFQLGLKSFIENE